MTYNQRQNEIDNFLKTLKPKFEAALAKANIGDVSNATGSLGEELLEPIFESDDTIKWKFYNVGAKTEKELQEEMKQLGIDIDTMNFKGSPSSTKSGSD